MGFKIYLVTLLSVCPISFSMFIVVVTNEFYKYLIKSMIKKLFYVNILS